MGGEIRGGFLTRRSHLFAHFSSSHAERSGGLEGLEARLAHVRPVRPPFTSAYSRGGMGPRVIGVRWLERLCRERRERDNSKFGLEIRDSVELDEPLCPLGSGRTT